MSKRKNPKPRHTFEVSAILPPPPAGVSRAYLDDRSAHALATLRMALYALRRALWADEPPTAAPHVAARLHDATAPISECIWTLTTRLLRHATGAEAVPAATLHDAEQAVIAATIALEPVHPGSLANPPLGAEPSRGLQAGDALSLDEAGSLLHEAALEELDAELELLIAPDGTMSLVWGPMPPDSATVALIDPLLEAAEYFTELNDLLEFERVAAAWWFDCWVPGVKSRTTTPSFATASRKREWVLADRPTVTTGKPVVAAFGSAPLNARFPAKQAALARAFPMAHSSFFVVRSRDGARTVLEDLENCRTFHVHEHSEEMHYGAGDIAAGRLIPIRKGTFLRSPGMVTYTPDERPGNRSSLRSIWPTMRDGLDEPALAVEAVLSTLLLAWPIPRRREPARSKREAQDLLCDLQDALASAGIRRDAAPGEGPADPRQPVDGTEHRRLADFALDPTIAEYCSALGTQAGPSAVGDLRAGGRPRLRLE